MADRSRWDPEMRAAQEANEAAAARFPPIRLEQPFQPHRETNDALGLLAVGDGPAVVETQDRWVFARGRRVLCRLHKPKVGTALPVLVYFHGGGWVWSSIDTHDRLARELALASGCAVLNVDYALAPEAVFPQALEECAGVVHGIAARAAEWNLDATRIMLGGDSAGGNLAIAAALMLRDGNGPPLCGILAIYPVCDSDYATASYRDYATGHVLTEEKMRFYWRSYAPGQERNPLAAPLHARLAGLPPVLIQLAELDVLRSEGEAMAAKLREAGVTTELATYPGMLHGFVRATATVARAREAVADAGAWIARIAGESA